VIGSSSDSIERDVSAPELGTTYESSDPSTVLVDPNGRIRGVNFGQTDISIRNGSLSAVVVVDYENAFTSSRSPSRLCAVRVPWHDRPPVQTATEQRSREARATGLESFSTYFRSRNFVSSSSGLTSCGLRILRQRFSVIAKAIAKAKVGCAILRLVLGVHSQVHAEIVAQGASGRMRSG
jgi:hypothetical protein